MPRIIQLSWSDLIAHLPIEYLIPSQTTIAASARKRAAAWIEIWERREAMQLTEIERAEVDAVFVQLLTAHWEIGNVMRGNLKLNYFFYLLNFWGCISQSGASERLLPRGIVITERSQGPEMVRFELQPSFLHARIEAFHAAYGTTDDGLAFQDVTAAHLFDTINAIFEADGRQPVVVDLRHWDAALILPRYEELEALVQALRLQREPKGEIDASAP